MFKFNSNGHFLKKLASDCYFKPDLEILFFFSLFSFSACSIYPLVGVGLTSVCFSRGACLDTSSNESFTAIGLGSALELRLSAKTWFSGRCV